MHHTHSLPVIELLSLPVILITLRYKIGIMLEEIMVRNHLRTHYFIWKSLKGVTHLIG